MASLNWHCKIKLTGSDGTVEIEQLVSGEQYGNAAAREAMTQQAVTMYKALKTTVKEIQ